MTETEIEPRENNIEALKAKIRIYRNPKTQEGWVTERDFIRVWGLLQKAEESKNEITTEYMAQNSMFEDLTSQYNSRFRKEQMVQKLATAEVLGDEAASLNISEVARPYKQNKWFKVGMWTVVLVVGFFLVWQLSSNVQFRTDVFKNLFGIGIVVGLAVLGFYIAKMQTRKK